MGKISKYAKKHLEETSGHTLIRVSLTLNVPDAATYGETAEIVASFVEIWQGEVICQSGLLNEMFISIKKDRLADLAQLHLVRSIDWLNQNTLITR